MTQQPPEPLASERAFSVAMSAGGVALLTLRVPGSALNLLRPQHAVELVATLDALEARRELRAIVLTSGEPAAFSAGADLADLARPRGAQDGVDIARLVQQACARLAALDLPVVAAIHGPCLGAGAALALAAGVRVATTHASTMLGFPEVRLGLIPIGNVTHRLPEVVGLRAALTLLLEGRPIPARHALALGLIDELAAPGLATEAAIRRALVLAEQHRHQPRLARRVLSRVTALRARVEARRTRNTQALVAAERAIETGAFGRHSAPVHLLRVVRAALERGPSAGREAERRAFGELLISPEAGHLIWLSRQLRALAREGSDEADAEPTRLESLGIVGAGPRGATLAAAATAAGLTVRLRDRSAAALTEGIRTVRAALEQDVAHGHLDAHENERALGRLTVTTDCGGFGGVPLVIEDTPEEGDAKRRVLRELAAHGHPRVVIASATVTESLSSLATGWAPPQRLVGWVQPAGAERSALVEIAVSPSTAPWASSTAVHAARALGHTAIVVQDTPCFYTPRLFGAWLLEALRLLAEGHAGAEIDAALADFGFAAGPLALLDRIGPALGLRIVRALRASFGARLSVPRTAEDALAEALSSGKPLRASRGLRSRDGVLAGLLRGRAAPAPDGGARRAIIERCTMTIVNEAVLCFGEGVIESARDADIAAVVGLGFPGFRGGPLRYVEEIGTVEAVRRLDRLAAAHGVRFAAAPLLVEMRQSGGTFHGMAQVFPGSHRRHP